MKFIEWFRSLIAPPSDFVIAARNLEEHKRQLLNAKASRSYAAKMVMYHEEQIEELTERVQRKEVMQ